MTTKNDEPVRDEITGQFKKGHKKLPGAGRPPGKSKKIINARAATKISKQLDAQLRYGAEDAILLARSIVKHELKLISVAERRQDLDPDEYFESKDKYRPDPTAVKAADLLAKKKIADLKREDHVHRAEGPLEEAIRQLTEKTDEWVSRNAQLDYQPGNIIDAEFSNDEIEDKVEVKVKKDD